MADTKKIGIALLATKTGVDLNGTAADETTLYTVPTGKSCLIFAYGFRDFSANATSSAITCGKTGGSCDEFFGSSGTKITMSGFSGTTKGGFVMGLPAFTAAGTIHTILTAGQAAGVEITDAAGVACTCTIDVFGYTYDA